MEIKRTIFWTRVATDDKVIYTYQNGWFNLFIIFILGGLIAIPILGWILGISFIFYWYVYPAPGKELRQVMKNNQVLMNGQYFSSSNPMTITVDRKIYDFVTKA